MHNLMFSTALYKSLEMTVMWISVPCHIVTNAQMSTSRHTGFYTNPSLFPTLWESTFDFMVQDTLYLGINQNDHEVRDALKSLHAESSKNSLHNSHHSVSLATRFLYLLSLWSFLFAPFSGSKLLLPLSPITCNWFFSSIVSGTHSQVNPLIPKSKDFY